VWKQLPSPGCARFSKVAEDAAKDILAFSAFPKTVWRRIWPNSPREGLNREIRQRTDAVGIFANWEAIIRLVGAVLAEQTDEWTVTRQYMTQESLAQATALAISSGRTKQEPALAAQLAA